MSRYKEWTDIEDGILVEYYTKHGIKGVSGLLDRSDLGIQKRAKKLGLKYGGIKIKYLKENLNPIVKDSKTISEVLNKLGLRCAGGNFKTINKYINEYGIDTSHFDENVNKIKSIKNRVLKNKKPLDEILVENSNYNRGDLKKRLIKENILDYKCSKCGNTGEWMGKKLVLQLEHKNGIHNDNRLENLEFMCPNCHSQTDTFAGRNLKKKKEPIERASGFTKKQISNHKSRRKAERPPYEQLINEIDELGYVGTGKKYGVSDNAIRKWKKYYEKLK